MMKLKLLRRNNGLIFSFLFVCVSVFSQSIEEVFVKMPDILNPTLSSQNRLELLEYHKAHQSDSTVNRFGNQAHLILMDTLNDRIVVKNTPTSTFDIKINYSTDSVPYIGIIRTVCAPVCHSTVEFYDTAWNLIPLQFIMPKAIEWLDGKSINPDIIDSGWLKKTLDISFISLSFGSDNNVLTAKNNTLDFLSAEDRKIIKPFLSDKILTYQLQNRMWVYKP